MKQIIGWLAVLLLLPVLAVGYAGGIILATFLVAMRSAARHVEQFGNWLGSDDTPKE